MLATLLTSLSLLAASPPLRIGQAAVEIHGEDSMVIAGGIGAAFAKGQEGKLRAQAIVLAQDEKIAIVACDVLMIRRDYLDRAAHRCEEACGIPFANILINATHTHHAPSTCTVHGYELDEAFSKRVEDAIVESVVQADRALARSRSAELLFWLGEESSVGQNSRLLLKDGTIFWVGPRDDAVRPTGPFDPELPVLAFREDDRLRAILWNHSTHNIGTLAGGVRSPGIYGMASQEIEAKTGALAIYLAGAFGSTHNLTVPAKEAVFRLEQAMEKAIAKARPTPVDGIAALKREFTIHVRNFDEAREDAAVSDYCRKRLPEEFARYTIDVFRAMRKGLAPHQGEARKTHLQALRIGEIAIAAAPGELFTSLGLEIKRRSPFRHTYVAGVANDWIGYIPDEEAYALGGYQLWTGLHSYVAPGTGEGVVEEIVKLLAELETMRPKR